LLLFLQKQPFFDKIYNIFPAKHEDSKKVLYKFFIEKAMAARAAFVIVFSSFLL
jgi:hypothetical protein